MNNLEACDKINVGCYNGYVCKFFYEGHELIHGGGLPKELRSIEDNLRIEKGAPEYSNITVFPFGGIPEEVFVGEREIINRDRHGLSRSLPWKMVPRDFCNEKVIFNQICEGEAPIKNIKYNSSKGNSEYLDAMFPFEIQRVYSLGKGVLHSEIKIVNPGDDFNYSLWDHSIFISPKDLKKGYLCFEYKNQENKFNLDDVSKLKGNVKLLDSVEKISFINSEFGVGFNFKSKSFGNLMIWSPENKGVFSIESKSHPGIEREFPSSNSRLLASNSSETYYIDIIPFSI